MRQAPRRASSRARHEWSTVGTAIMALVMTAAFAAGYAGLQRFRARASPRRLSRARFEVLTPPTSDPMSFALSADGRQLAFVSASEGVSKLWVRPIDQITAQTFVGTDGASYPFWTPDGRSIAFFADGKLKRLNFDGSLPADHYRCANGPWRHLEPGWRHPVLARRPPAR